MSGAVKYLRKNASPIEACYADAEGRGFEVFASKPKHSSLPSSFFTRGHRGCGCIVNVK